MNVSVEIRRNEVSPSLKLIINALSNNNTKSMLSVAGREFLSMTRQNFGKSGNYRTDSWPSLSRNYARRIHTSTATLLRTGELLASIKLGPVLNNGISIYTKDRRAAALAFGYKPNNLPARNFWPMENTKNPNYSRLNYKADRQLYSVIVKQLTQNSSGNLPYQTMKQRSTLTYGNVFSAQV
jgi:hypothetical protein